LRRRGLQQGEGYPLAVAVVVWEPPVPVVGDVKVEVAVVVVVEEGPAGGPTRAVDPGGPTDVLERPIAAIAIEDVVAVVAQEDVRIAVVVDIADDDPVAEPREAQAGRPGDIPEPTAAQVAVEPVGAGSGGADRQPGRVGEVEVEPAVAVGVQDRDPGTVRGR